jgi:hypothetical protein
MNRLMPFHNFCRKRVPRNDPRQPFSCLRMQDVLSSRKNILVRTLIIEIRLLIACTNNSLINVHI